MTVLPAGAAAGSREHAASRIHEARITYQTRPVPRRLPLTSAHAPLYGGLGCDACGLDTRGAPGLHAMMGTTP